MGPKVGLILSLIWIVTGCATGPSLRQKALTIPKGSSVELVRARLGEPRYTMKDGDTVLWFYESGYTSCAVPVKGGKVDMQPLCEGSAPTYTYSAPTETTSFGSEYLKRSTASPAAPTYKSPSCSGLKPLAPYGCNKVCINGEWADVCR